MIDQTRALRAYTDVVAVEHDAETGLLRVVTLSDSYVVDVREARHQCPDRTHNDVGICKHLVAALATTGELDVPVGWLVVEDLDERTDPAFTLPGTDVSVGDLPDFEDFRVATDGGQGVDR